MKIFDDLEYILNSHECKCYEIDKENKKLIFVGQNNSCCTLHPAVADLTGYLLSNNIDYDMDEEHHITLHHITNIKIDTSLSNLHHTKI